MKIGNCLFSPLKPDERLRSAYGFSVLAYYGYCEYACTGIGTAEQPRTYAVPYIWHFPTIVY